MVSDDDDHCPTVWTSVMAGTEPPGVDDHGPVPMPKVLMVRRTTLVGITPTDDEGVLLTPGASGSPEGCGSGSISRLGQAFEHRLDAQARTGLQCGLKRFKEVDGRAGLARLALYP